MSLARLLTLGALLFAAARAQTSTTCNPTNSTCPKDDALGTTLFQTWNSSSPSALDSDYWTMSAGQDLIEMKDAGLAMTLNKKGDSVTAQTKFYIFWGEVEVQFQAAAGQGIISTVNLLSDDLDEIDVEVQGANTNNVSTNWYGQDPNQENADWYPVNPSPQSQMHTYKVVWNQQETQWWFDGQMVRSLPYAAPKQYPQTPCFIKMGVWPAGDSDEPGVVTWAGGPTQWDKGPFTMTVKSIKITDGSTNASSYAYAHPSDGDWRSIFVTNGTSDAAQAVNKPPPQTASQRWHGLSTGAKIGIACGVLGAISVAVLAFIVYFFKQRIAGKKMRVAEDAAWDREHTELMQYQGGAYGKDEFGVSSVSVATSQGYPAKYR